MQAIPTTLPNTVSVYKDWSPCFLTIPTPLDNTHLVLPTNTFYSYVKKDLDTDTISKSTYTQRMTWRWSTWPLSLWLARRKAAAMYTCVRPKRQTYPPCLRLWQYDVKRWSTEDGTSQRYSRRRRRPLSSLFGQYPLPVRSSSNFRFSRYCSKGSPDDMDHFLAPSPIQPTDSPSSRNIDLPNPSLPCHRVWNGPKRPIGSIIRYPTISTLSSHSSSLQSATNDVTEEKVHRFSAMWYDNDGRLGKHRIHVDKYGVHIVAVYPESTVKRKHQFIGIHPVFLFLFGFILFPLWWIGAWIHCTAQASSDMHQWFGRLNCWMSLISVLLFTIILAMALWYKFAK
ncbi:uncharacterized protein BYT42DRAFT_588623 [Radiomyces spectabilis]|uniref:uncharacterized protein n=1 Tax=Radiomyces spectabilis TaxID=64574 RepID=UPI00221E3F20|nr:uncharacterized protein BYT42DRAFT_588623 [Radiomyces spectabilis]KAI8366024.1 hypothetical protein BYT42DRAFT_588623 [Radiomyces spectabilis]